MLRGVKVQQAGPWDGDDVAAVVLHQLRRKEKKRKEAYLWGEMMVLGTMARL
jgi:hypothetical protein